LSIFRCQRSCCFTTSFFRFLRLNRFVDGNRKTKEYARKFNSQAKAGRDCEIRKLAGVVGQLVVFKSNAYQLTAESAEYHAYGAVLFVKRGHIFDHLCLLVSRSCGRVVHSLNITLLSFRKVPMTDSMVPSCRFKFGLISLTASAGMLKSRRYTKEVNRDAYARRS